MSNQVKDSFRTRVILSRIGLFGTGAAAALFLASVITTQTSYPRATPKIHSMSVERVHFYKNEQWLDSETVLRVIFDAGLITDLAGDANHPVIEADGMKVTLGEADGSSFCNDIHCSFAYPVPDAESYSITYLADNKDIVSKVLLVPSTQSHSVADLEKTIGKIEMLRYSTEGADEFGMPQYIEDTHDVIFIGETAPTARFSVHKGEHIPDAFSGTFIFNHIPDSNAPEGDIKQMVFYQVDADDVTNLLN